MVLLRDRQPLDGQAVFDYLRTHWADLPSITDVETKEMATAGVIPGGVLGLGQMPMPVPRGDLEGPAAAAWHWPTAAADVGAHESHVIVFASSTKLDQVDVRLLHSKLVASVAALTNALGVYVGNALLVRAAADYVAEARAASREALPTMLWIGFNPVSDGDGFSAYTTGLTAFGLPELEVRGSMRPPAEVFGTMADAATYELQTGRVLRDGDTFGHSVTERVPVRHTRSAFLPDTTVARLEL